MKKTLALVLVCLLSANAYADFVGAVVRIEAQTADDIGIFVLPLQPPVPDVDTVTFQLTSPSSIYSDTVPDKSLGVLESLLVELSGDPAVTLNFAITAGASDTTFTITSATVTFLPLINPDAYATATLSVTDNNGNGATAAGLQTGNKCYEARYNGTVGWAVLIADVTAPVYSSNTGSERRPASGWETISDTLTSIQSEYKFTLTAGDFASGTSRFEVVPEPAALSLLFLGGILIMRRKARP